MAPQRFALLLLVCQPDRFELAAVSEQDEPFYVRLSDGSESWCRLYEPPWATKLTKRECNTMKAELMAPIIGPGVRPECVPLDTE